MVEAGTHRSDGGAGAASPRRSDNPCSSTRRVAADARELADALRSASGDWSRLVQSGMRRNPYAALGVAAGVGYVLGGGLAPSALRLAANAAWRVAAGVALRNVIDAVNVDVADAN